MNVIIQILAPLLGALFKDVFAKFVVLTGVFAVLAIVVPMAINYVSPLIGTGSLSSAFSGIPAGMWYFIDMADLSFGFPLVISAFVARFLIRRLPFIG